MGPRAKEFMPELAKAFTIADKQTMADGIPGFKDILFHLEGANAS